jgi:hypothetical protein
MGLSFLKTGAESAALAKQEAAEAQKRKEETGKLWRFFLGDNEDAKITFVDGELGEEGYLNPPRFYEHTVFYNGKYENFICPEKTNPGAKDACPNCEAGDRASLVAVFTIIDHRTFQSKDKTKTYSNTRKLFVAKPQTFELLNKLAMKRGGLVGCTFDVSRAGDKAPAVGSMFDFVEKHDIVSLQTMFMVEKTDPKTNKVTTVTNFLAADYENELIYRTGDELRKLGLGKPSNGFIPPSQGSVAKANYANVL